MSGSKSHPSTTDLANLAAEKLGAKKTQRILEHCKECPECADALLEAVGNRPVEREPLRLSKWNWISIGILLIALIVVFALLIWILRGASQRQVETLEAPEVPSETVYRESPNGWFEALFAHISVSLHADRLLRVDGTGVRLIDPTTGEERRDELWLDFDGVMDATFDGNGSLARQANKRRDLGWFIQRDGQQELTSIPRDATVAWAAGNRDVAWTRPPGTRLYLGYPPEHRAYDVDGRILGLAWAPSGQEAYALIMDGRGSASLVRAHRARGRVDTVRAGLDASALPNGLAVAPDGAIFVALASPDPPDPRARHRPAADRDLDIYRIDPADGDLRPVVITPGDDFWPTVAAGSLYWTHNEHRASVVLVPLGVSADTAPAVPVAGTAVDEVDAHLPAWHPSGDRLAFTRGEWRLADWGLPFDVAAVELTDAGAAVGEVEPLIEGYHQDLTPAWSPDGRWLAYRSRRSATPVPYYSGPGVADDLFLRAAGEPTETERRITDAGWEVGRPSWSPDGRRLVFDSWDRGGVPGVSRPWVLSIDPRSGAVLGRDPVPLPEMVDGSVSAVWSPVADELLLIERRDPGSQALWIAPLGESGATHLTDFSSFTPGAADWLPDGTGVVYAAAAEGRVQLFLIAVAGGEPRRISDDRADLLHPRVSPDGRWIAATRLEQQKEVRRLELGRLR